MFWHKTHLNNKPIKLAGTYLDKNGKKTIYSNSLNSKNWICVLNLVLIYMIQRFKLDFKYTTAS